MTDVRLHHVGTFAIGTLKEVFERVSRVKIDSLDIKGYKLIASFSANELGARTFLEWVRLVFDGSGATLSVRQEEGTLQYFVEWINQ